MKRLLIGLALLPALALAQSVPNGGITQGQIWSVPQWTAAWQSKADTSLFGSTDLTQAPLMQFPLGTTQGYLTLVGIQAGKNLSLSSIEATLIGYGAGGAGGNSGDGLGGGTGMTGVENTCVGWFACTQMTTGAFNAAFGVNVLGHESTGVNNSAFGIDAMRNTAAGSNNNTAVGFQACRNGNGVLQNTCIGTSTLQGNWSLPSTTTGINNTAVGFNAMSSTGYTTAGNNVAVGGSAFAAATTGVQNVFVGAFAGQAATNAAGNVAEGYNAYNVATSFSDVVAVGQNAGQFATGNQNTLVGSRAMTGVNGSTTGTGNTALGYQALLPVTSGSNNVAIGYQVGSTTCTTCGRVILIGTTSAVASPAAATQQWLNIENTIRGGTSALTGGNLTTCGTAPALNATATEMAGTITTGTGATACTLSLNHATGTAPTCLVTARSGTAPAYTTTDTGSASTLQLTTAAASATYDYFCPVH